MTFQKLRVWMLVVLYLCWPNNTSAFSLLGPFAPWMTPEVGFIHDEAWDVGGPRNLGDEFRWNVPVLTYGFDDNFKNFFGQPGIDAVEKAVAMLNAIPRASQTDLSTARTTVLRLHTTAQIQDLVDLQSLALVYLVEQMGLANPIRFTWIVNSMNAPLGTEEQFSFPNGYIIQRNYDPASLAPSPYVSGVKFTFFVGEFGSNYPMLPTPNRILSEIAIDQTASWSGTSVAQSLPSLSIDYGFRSGMYYFALSRDDLGAIRYLLDPTNINVEPTLPTVRAKGGGADFVNVAPRPGVDKITFDRFDPGQPPITNIFIDHYLMEGSVKTQTLQRVIQTPDILFTAANHPRQLDVPPLVRRTGPNFSHQNETGAGILQPEVVISFQKLGDIYREPYLTYEGEAYDTRWSSFDSRTLTPSPIFPVGPAYQGGRTLSTREIQDQNGPALEWKLRLIAGVQYAIETSADLVNWTAITNITAAPIHTLTNSLPNQSQTFWRVRRISGK